MRRAGHMLGAPAVPRPLPPRPSTVAPASGESGPSPVGGSAGPGPDRLARDSNGARFGWGGPAGHAGCARRVVGWVGDHAGGVPCRWGGEPRVAMRAGSAGPRDGSGGRWATGRPRLHGVSILDVDLPRDAASAAAGATHARGTSLVLRSVPACDGRGGRFVPRPVLAPVARGGRMAPPRVATSDARGVHFAPPPVRESHPRGCASHHLPCGPPSHSARVWRSTSAGPSAGREPDPHLGASPTASPTASSARASSASAPLVASPRAGWSAVVARPLLSSDDDRTRGGATKAADRAGVHPGGRSALRRCESAQSDHGWLGRDHALALA